MVFVDEVIMYLAATRTDIYLNKVDDKDSKINALNKAIDLLEYFNKDMEIS